MAYRIIAIVAFLLCFCSIAKAQVWGPVRDSSAVPQRYVGKVISRFPHGIAEGTGVLISAKHVLTAGHMIYDQQRKTRAISVMFIPGYGLKPGKVGSQQPFGAAWALKSAPTKAFMSGNPYEDVAIIKLDRRIGDQTRGWMELGDWQLGRDYQLLTIGYPTNYMSGLVQVTTNSYWERFELVGQPVLDPMSIVSWNLAVSFGISGSPLFEYSGGAWRVRGIIKGQMRGGALGTRLTWPLVVEMRNWMAANQ